MLTPDEVNKLSKPVTDAFVEAWMVAGNEVGTAQIKKLKVKHPDDHQQIVSTAVMAALPNFIMNCITSISDLNHLQLTVLVVNDVLSYAMRIERQEKISGVSLEELMDMLGGVITKHGKKTPNGQCT